MAPRGLSAVLPLVLLATTVRGLQEDKPVWTGISTQRGPGTPNTTLHVKNTAAAPIVLMGCNGKAVQPGQSVDVPVTGLTRFWVVPEGLNLDCHSGPFGGLFYFAADFLGDKLLVSMGRMPKAAGEANTTASESAERAVAGLQLGAMQQGSGGPATAAAGSAGSETAPGQPGNSTGTATAQGQAGGTSGGAAAAGQPGNATGGAQGGEAGPMVRCRADKCDSSIEMPTLPSDLMLTVMAPSASPLSFYRCPPPFGFGGVGGFGGIGGFGAPFGGLR